jgi:hypothetical protein
VARSQVSDPRSPAAGLQGKTRACWLGHNGSLFAV